MRRVLLAVSAAALIWGAIVLLTGGIDWRVAGIAIRSRAPDRALLIGLTLLAVQAIAFREAFARDMARAAAIVRPLLPAAAAVGALALAAHAIRFGAFTAGGSDAFGYLSQAYAWAHGALPSPLPHPFSVPWPSGDASLAPLGYRPGPAPHTMVPTYAPGLPLMMAAALAAGDCGPYFVIPASAAVAVWLTFVLGRRAGGPAVGLLAAVFFATSPVVLMQSQWPMSDIPAAALTTGAACAALGTRRRDALVCGMLTAAALLVRPNLPVLPVVFLAFLVATASGRERWIRAAAFSAPVGIAAGAVAMLYSAWYGSPFNSGYGAAGEIFLLSNVAPNLARYPVWLVRSQSPLVVIAILPLLPAFSRRIRRSAVALCAALFIATLAAYLLYSTFEEWWYLRFLLPALPALMVLLAAGIVDIGRRLPDAWRMVAVAAATVVLVVFTTRFVKAEVPPEPLKAAERRYADVGVFLKTLPANAVILSVQESGSARYYSGRYTIRWDLIDRDWTPRVPAELARLGLHPYLVIEDFELPQFRDWFGIAEGDALPWPLVARMRDNGGVAVLDLAPGPQAPAPVALEPGGARWCQPPAGR